MGRQYRKIIKNTGMLYLMNIAKIVFPLITLPYLTRVLSVECFGLVAFVKAIMQYMQIFVDFGFILSGTRDIVLARDSEERLNYEVSDILVAKCVISIIAFVGVVILLCCIPSLGNNKLFVVLSFFVVFLSCFFMDYIFRGLEIMEFITLRFVVMKAVTTISTFFIVRSDEDILWIPVLDILGSIVAIVFVCYQIHKIGIKFKISSAHSVISKIKSSSVFFFSNMSTTAFGALNTLVIGLYLSEVQVSYWSVCLQLVSGVQALYSPITSGVYPEMVKSKSLNVIKKISLICMPVILLGCVTTYFVADYVIVLVAGKEYLPAGETLRCLIPIMFVGFFSMLFGWPVLGAIGKEKETTMTTICSALFQFFGVVCLVYFDILTLTNIAVLRVITEIILFSLRYGYFLRFRELLVEL